MSSVQLQLFPAQAPGIEVPATTAVLTAVALPGEGSTMRVVNEGTVMVYLAVGASNVAATLQSASVGTTSCAVLPGSDSVFSIPGVGQQYISTICELGASTLQVYVAEGF